MIKIAIADDHDLIRMGLRAMVEREDDLTVVGEASDGHDAIHLIRQQRPDILLLDIKMPGMDGLATLRKINTDPALTTRVIVVTTFELDRYVFESLQAGAHGFVLKDTAPDELIRAIRVVAAGEALLSPSVTQRVLTMFSQPASPGTAPIDGLDRLTERERDLVGWVAAGYSNEEIARELVLSPDTVRTHVSRAMVKLNAKSRAQLAVFGVRAGLTVPNPPR